MAFIPDASQELDAYAQLKNQWRIALQKRIVNSKGIIANKTNEMLNIVGTDVYVSIESELETVQISVKGASILRTPQDYLERD